MNEKCEQVPVTSGAADQPARLSTRVSVNGKWVSVPCAAVQEREIISSGRFPRIATVVDEEWIEPKALLSPYQAVESLRQSEFGADLLSFADPLGTPGVRFPELPHIWDNAAVVPLTTFKEWWEDRVPQETRKNVRRSQRRGVTVRQVVLDEALAAGIKAIYDETPLRQGRPFWHYGKDLATVLRDNSTYAERSEFFGAYFQENLIGFIKVVYVKDVARIMQILSMNAHFDKRPPNALLAKAIERAAGKGMRYFVYGKHVYGNKANSPVTEFKRRNGFEEMRFPRYYLPVTVRGHAALALRLHLGARNLLPEPVIEFALSARARLLSWKNRRSAAATPAEPPASALAD